MNFPEIDLISREDLLKQFEKPKPPPEDFPVENKVWRCNNHIIKEWDEKVLLRIPTHEGKVPLAAAMKSFEIFLEGKEVMQFKKNEGHLPVIEVDKVMYWIDVLRDSSIEELYPLGSGNLMDAFMLISRAMKFHFAQAKWEKVYSQSDDPLVWMVLTAENFKDPPLPFELDNNDMRSMEKKIKTLLQMKPQPF